MLPPKPENTIFGIQIDGKPQEIGFTSIAKAEAAGRGVAARKPHWSSGVRNSFHDIESSWERPDALDGRSSGLAEPELCGGGQHGSANRCQ